MPKVGAKTALVTGASSGIGKEVAKRLANNGFQVFATARSLEKMDELSSLGATVLRTDISKDDEIEALVAAVLGRVEAVDVLVNNAGFGLYGPIEELGIDQARYQFEVNVFGPARLTQLLLPAMRAQGSGTIVNISSMGGKIYTLLGGWYHASKHALEGWSDCLRTRTRPFRHQGRGHRTRPGRNRLRGRGGRRAPRGLGRGAVSRARPDGRDGDPARLPAGAQHRSRQSCRCRAAGHNGNESKTRYVVGKYARPMIALRKWLGDRAFDRVMMMQMR